MKKFVINNTKTNYIFFSVTFKILFKLYLPVILLILSCKKKLDKNNISLVPDLIRKDSLINQYNLAKWEVYKGNMYDSVLVEKLNIKVHLLECDLGKFHVNVVNTYLRDDTLTTIYISPTYLNYRTDFLGNSSIDIYGASFKGNKIKFLPNGDKSFLEYNDSISKIEDLKLINYIIGNNDKVNSWLIEYATSKGFIK